MAYFFECSLFLYLSSMFPVSIFVNPIALKSYSLGRLNIGRIDLKSYTCFFFSDLCHRFFFL